MTSGSLDTSLDSRTLSRMLDTASGKDFMNAPWLFAEAYKYRRLHECFSISRYWKVRVVGIDIRAF